MEVEPLQTENADYWASAFTTIHIDKAGRLYQPRNAWTPTPGVFVLERRMKGVSPADLAIADARQPLLKWVAIPGATHYRGDFRGGDQMKWFDVDETQYRIGGGLSAGGWCAWRVWAVDTQSKTLVRGEGNFFGNGTDKAIMEKMARPPERAAFLQKPDGLIWESNRFPRRFRRIPQRQRSTASRGVTRFKMKPADSSPASMSPMCPPVRRRWTQTFILMT